MAAKEIYDYLSAVTPDYSTTVLEVSPQRILVEEASWKQNIFETDDRSEQVITLGGPFFDVTLEWPAISESDAGTIFDFFNDTNKGRGFARSFQWSHPKDGHVYVVKFRSVLKRTYSAEQPSSMKIDSVGLRVVGRINDS
jgi:hypothetical protein